MMRRCWGVPFSALSRETVRVYVPHPVDQQTANRLCTDPYSAHTLRMLGIVDGEHAPRSSPNSSSTSVSTNPTPGAIKRAACRSMAHLLPLLRRLERRRLALVGGVRGDNPRAIHFYEKFGFAKVGEFQSREVVSFDMIAEL